MNILSEVVLPTLAAAGGVGAFIAGLAGFLKASVLARQQAKLTAELEELKGTVLARLEMVKLDAERLKFAHTKQFEKEFGLYEQLWKSLWTLMFHARRLGDDFDREMTGIVTGEDEFKKNRDAVFQAFNPVAEICEHYAPFLHEKVHAELDRFVKMCVNAWVNDKYRTLSQLDKNPTRSQDIENQYHVICDAIRWRIGLTTINWHPNSAVERDAPQAARPSP